MHSCNPWTCGGCLDSIAFGEVHDVFATVPGFSHADEAVPRLPTAVVWPPDTHPGCQNGQITQTCHVCHGLGYTEIPKIPKNWYQGCTNCGGLQEGPELAFITFGTKVEKVNRPHCGGQGWFTCQTCHGTHLVLA
jgi:hypothetical protein